MRGLSFRTQKKEGQRDYLSPSALPQRDTDFPKGENNPRTLLTSSFFFFFNLKVRYIKNSNCTPQNCKYEILPQTQGLRLLFQRQLMLAFIAFLPETLSAHTHTNKDMHTGMHKLSNSYTEMGTHSSVCFALISSP